MSEESGPADLFNNIREARMQINRLKNEAQVLASDPFNSANHNMKQYMKNVSYSLSKNEQTIDRKCKEYKSKLPNIRRSDLNLSLNTGYKKHKKTFQHASKNKNSEQSTKIENSLSFSLNNRAAKIHSVAEKNYRQDIAVGESGNSQSQFCSEFIKLKEEAAQLDMLSVQKKERSGSYFLRGVSSKNKRLNYIDLNRSSVVKEIEKKAKEDMQYNEIVDKYSRHEFMIIHGSLADESPEFSSYARIFESIFPRIREQIARLQALLAGKNISFARFDGKKLSYLCLLEEVSKNQLIDCLIDEDGQIRRTLLPATRFSSPGGLYIAAVKIQAFYKMQMTRAKYSLLKSKTIMIQRFFRRNLQRLGLERQIHERNSKIIERFEMRQDQLISEWKQIRSGKRVEIHLNSIEVEEEKRLTIENFTERQNIQLSRIFRLKDQNLIIVYVSTAELSPELINYYYRMLDLASIPKYHDRLLFFSPSDAHRFPQHFSVSKLLYYSSKTLRQLKIITEDLPTLLLPGYPSNQLIKICDLVECYLFAGGPQQVKPFTTRSQTLRFFKNLSLRTLPSAMEMYDYGEFLNTFSVLIIKNASTTTWVLKIDDEFGGRGIAYLELGKFRKVQSLLAQIDYEGEDDFFATNADQANDISNYPKNQEIAVKIRDFLKEGLPERLRIATPTLYKSYEEFMGRFIKKGGVIEAKPLLHNREPLSFPSLTFCVEPTGDYKIVTSYEKILGSPYRSYGCSFPQKTMDLKVAHNSIRLICESFKLRKIFGYFTLDFICAGGQEAWVIDIDPFINDYTASYFLFDLLMGGSYFSERNSYLVERQDDKSETVSVDTMTSEAQTQLSNSNVVERTYTFLPHFFNPNLVKFKIRDFFKQARMEKFNFDVGNKEGLCIMLLDQLTSGTMSLMAVSGTPFQAVGALKRVVDFMVRISEVKNVNYGRTDSQPATDRILIKDVLSLFISLLRKDERSDAKKKAIRQFDSRRDLEYIN